MSVETRTKGKVTIVDVRGKLTVGQEVPLRDKVRELLAAGEQRFVIDMSEVPFMDSAGLGETAACKMRICGKGGVVKLVLPRKSKLVEIFKITGFDHAFEIHHDVEAAIASFID